MSFFIVRDFFSFDLFAECPVGPRSAQFPSASKANLATCPSEGSPRRPSRSGRPAANVTSRDVDGELGDDGVLTNLEMLAGIGIPGSLRVALVSAPRAVAARRGG